MSWGINPWGVSPWSGFGPGSILTGPAVINSRPFPTEITPLGVLVGGTNNLQLLSEAPAEDNYYNGYWLVYFGAKVVSREVADYSSARVVTLSHDLPVSIPDGAQVFLFAPDEWVPDLLHVGIRPSVDKLLDLATLSLLHNYSQFAFDGIRPQATQGNLAAQHAGQVPSVGDFDFFQIDPATAPAALLGIDDSFKGLVCSATAGTGQGQVRRIIRYDSATQSLYPDVPFDVPFDETTRYDLAATPLYVMANTDLPLTYTDIDLDARYTGLSLIHDGTVNHRNAVVFRQGGAYNTTRPVQMAGILHVESATFLSGRAGLVWGMQLGLSPVRSVKFELMHDGAGAPGNLILRTHKPNAAAVDTVLIPNADPAQLSGFTVSFFCSYSPTDDKLRVAMNSLFPIPGSPLISDLEFAGFVTSSDFEGHSLPQKQGGNLAFFGAGLSGAAATVQWLRFAFLIEGEYIVQDGVVKGFLDGEVLSAFPQQTERGKLPLAWVRPWFPLAGGKSEPTFPVTVSNDRLDGGALVIKREEVEGVATPDTPYSLVRYEPQLEDRRTRSFSMTTRIRAVEGDHLNWDVIGAAFGALIGPAGSRLHIQLALISDLGREKIGLLMRDTGGFGLALADFHTADSEWSTDYRTYRLVYSEENGGDPFLMLFEDNNPKPILNLAGSVLTSMLPDDTTSIMNLAGVYLGLLSQPFSVELRHEFTRYFYNLLGYTPQLYFEQPIPTEPDTAPLPWVRTESVLGTIAYDKEFDSRRAATNGRLRLESRDSQALFTRDLADPTLPAEHVYRPTDGFVAEFRVQLDADNLPSSVYDDTVEGRPGLWSGVGLYLDDGADRIVFGFADGGSRGRFIFVAGADPTDTTQALDFSNIQSWVEASIRQPGTWFQYVHNIDWTEEHLYRVERSAAITSDRNARVRVFVDNSETPVIEVPFLRGRFVQGTVQEIGWGHLVAGRNAVSYWREVLYGVSSGFDIHTNQGLSVTQRRMQMVESSRPTLASMAVHVEES